MSTTVDRSRVIGARQRAQRVLADREATEDCRVLAWRVLQLLDAGAQDHTAELLAMSDGDLHRMAEQLRAGVDAELLARIYC